ncbi:carbon monoxide dehydrogenase subunit G [Silvimonas terrae]|uniref:Carbon monoxide dehydrogenase subunit G n=1 Tax=Silvimonas terrae TaxID=300266 RepID=A0A840RAD9_9NEIS|nr:SRPBCC family protein [Silvimonas terrae]MBB5189564.1 carbon monoxide dehydrogenase subunit G [Silvimonas terrae]
MRFLISLSGVLALLAGMPACAQDTTAASPVAAHVEKNGETVTLESEFTVAVSREVAWQVLTDFDHMTSYIPNLSSSKILERTETTMKVEQKGVVPLGIFHTSYDSIRQMELKPMTEIRAHSVGGDSGPLSSVSTLSEKNGQTVVSYHAEWTPTSKLVGSLGTGTARDQLLHQFTAMEQEMLRRAHKAKADAASDAAATH